MLPEQLARRALQDQPELQEQLASKAQPVNKGLQAVQDLQDQLVNQEQQAPLGSLGQLGLRGR